ncbi:MAG TPA: sulfurtransferase, partial [Gammaproteobacteria bacterium]|nr:sulfurtransferase [Gammaproteobacteria bacterium]
MTNNTHTLNEVVVTTDWLAQHSADSDLRVFDCTTHLIHQSDPESDAPYIVQSGKDDYGEAHIPGAAFIDLQQDLSDTTSPYRFTCLQANQLAKKFGALGIGDNTTAVLYSQTTPQWATRIWWLLRTVGFDRACVLDGGLTRWQTDGRAVSSETTTHPPALLTTQPRNGLLVDKATVLSAIDDDSTCTINALRAVQHAGLDNGAFGHYGRPGRIPRSVNVPTNELVNPATMEFLPSEEIRSRLHAVG